MPTGRSGRIATSVRPASRSACHVLSQPIPLPIATMSKTRSIWVAPWVDPRRMHAEPVEVAGDHVVGLWRVAAVDDQHRLALEVGGVDHGRSWRADGRAARRRDRRAPGERHAGDAIDVVDRPADDADREPSGRERLGDVERRHRRRMDEHVGTLVAESGAGRVIAPPSLPWQKPSAEVGCGTRRRQLLARIARSGRRRRAPRGRRRAGARRRASARRVAARALEQRQAELGLELADALRQRWRRHVQPRRRPPEVALLGDGDEVAQAAQVDMPER